MKVFICLLMALWLGWGWKQSLKITAALLGLLVLNLHFSNEAIFLRTWLLSLYLFFLGYEDYISLYIARRWWLYSTVFLGVILSLPGSGGRLAAAVLFSLPAFVMSWKLGWMGSADGWFLLLFGFSLGLERMIVAMLLAVGMGLLYGLLVRQQQLPFLTFLSIGFYIAFFKGYLLFVFLLKLL